MKRFWQTATVAPDPAGHAILLDGKPMRLPGGAVLRVGPAALAAAIAAEWQEAGGAKGGEMSFADTPLTRIAGTAQERIAPDPEPSIAALARYGETDLLCHRAETPESLVRRQHEGWQPWLDWAAARFGARLAVTEGVVPVAQPPEALAALAAALAGQGRQDLVRRSAADAPCRDRAAAHRAGPGADGAGTRPLRRDRSAVLSRRGAAGAGGAAGGVLAALA